jgi:hypothetical protein
LVVEWIQGAVFGDFTGGHREGWICGEERFGPSKGGKVMLKGFLRNYLPRHRNRWNQLLHAVGVPLTFIVPVVLLVRGLEWYWAISCFLGGYAVQFIGHAIEGNDAGEVVFIRKMLGKPYTEYGPLSEYSRFSEGIDDRGRV